MSADDSARYKRQMRTVWIILFSVSLIGWLAILWFQSTSYDNFCYRIGNSLIKGLFAIVVIGLVSWIGYLFETRRKKVNEKG